MQKIKIFHGSDHIIEYPKYMGGKEDIKARKEVNQFLRNRMEAILLDGYMVQGITARYAISNTLTYYREGNYYV